MAKSISEDAAVGVKDEHTGSPRRTLTTEIWGLLTLSSSLLLLLALASFRPALGEQPARNLIGGFGAAFADVMYFTFGVGSFFAVALMLMASASLLFGRRLFDRVGEGIGYAIVLFGSSVLAALLASEATIFEHRIGGWIGAMLGGVFTAAVGRVGGIILMMACFFVAFILITETSLIAMLEDGMVGIAEWWKNLFDSRRRNARRAFRELPETSEGEESAAPKPKPVLENASNEELDDVDVSDVPGANVAEATLSAFKSLTGRFARVWKRSAAWEDEVDEEGDEPAWTDELEFDAASEPAWVVELGGGDTDRVSVADEDIVTMEEDAPPPPPGARTQPVPSANVTMRVKKGSKASASSHDAESAEANNSSSAERPVERSASGAKSAERIDASDHTSAPEPQDSASGPIIIEPAALKNRKKAADLERAAQRRLTFTDGSSPWEPPPLSFLSYKESDGSHIDHDKLREQAKALEEALASFRVGGAVTGICPGPVVTRFEFSPESGTKLSKISNLSDDIAMALLAHKVRIIAPIPGKGCVGIEVPNDTREMVYFKEIIADDRFTRAKGQLTVALGKDIEGNPIVADLAKMPHLLVAGTTGSGKSVSVNAMITSILYNSSPDDVRLIMIDPKQLEFAIYKDIPHLLLPVVTDPAKAAAALQWAVQDMERRYKLMAELKVRNIKGYNKKLKELRAEYDAYTPAHEDEELPRRFEPLVQTDPDGRPSHRHMFYTVVIVDEFADLMMVAGKEVEMAVARLAQKARAAGIHCILATQRPSVDVITGLIKANFPTRMSFRLMSGTDSRTVLDTTGAENLLGMGDMLFRPPGRSDLVRVHGAYVDEDEIEKVCEFLKEQRNPEYDESILAAAEAPAGSGDEDDEVDELYDQAVSAVIEAGYASISMVQRKLRVGYNRSARMVEQMERDGVIGPATGGSSRREVLVGGAHIDA